MGRFIRTHFNGEYRTAANGIDRQLAPAEVRLNVLKFPWGRADPTARNRLALGMHEMLVAR
jgi:hypothetical protein